MGLVTGCTTPRDSEFGKKLSCFENHMAADVGSSHPRVTFPTGCLSHQDTGIFQYSSPPTNRLAGTRPSWTTSTGWSWLVLV